MEAAKSSTGRPVVFDGLDFEQVGCGYSQAYLGQNLEPFYQADKAAGLVNHEAADFLFKNLIIKLNEIGYYYGEKVTLQNSADLGQSISIGATKDERDTAYLAAMKALADKYPDDETRLFNGQMLLSTMPEGAMSNEIQPVVANILEEIYARKPNHPGVLHYLTHVYDDPINAEKGLPAARAYAKLIIAIQAREAEGFAAFAAGDNDAVIEKMEAAGSLEAQKRRGISSKPRGLP